MRRIPRLRQPSAVFTQFIQPSASAPTHTAVCRAAATSCASRPRDFSTTPNRTINQSRAWADRAKAEAAAAAVEEKVGTEADAEPPKTRPAEDEFLVPAPEDDPFAVLTAAQESTDPPPIQTDLVLPPTEPTVAPRAEDLAAGENYRPADTADGLEAVGGLQGWFSADKDHWRPSVSYVRFAPETKVIKPAVLELCAIRAVLEAVAVAAAVRGEKPGKRDWLAAAWRDDGREGLNRALGMEWTVDGNGKVKLGAGFERVAKALERTPEGDAVVKEAMVRAEEAQEILKKWNQSWKNISLEDAKLKFAVAKRIYQLTGQTIPDAKLLHINNAGQLLAILVKPPPPRKVYDAVQQRGELGKLPNVKVFAKRRTPVHEAQEVGLWKVVEQELKKRDLPVLGEDKVDRFREREWYRGPKPDKKDRKKRRH